MTHRAFRLRSALRFVRPSLLAMASFACGHPSEPDTSLEQPVDDAGVPPSQPDAAPAPVAVALPPVCSVDGWCWATQSLQGNTLRAVAANSPKDLWAVGALGLTLHFDGTSWSSHWAPLQKTLRGVWLQGDELWAVGDEAQLLHYVGEHWEAVALPDVPVSTSLRGVTGDGSGRMWVVGDGGLMFERRSGSWSRVDVGTAVALNAVWAGGGEAWAVGDAGTVLHLGNDAWTRVDAGTSRKLTSVHGRGREVWLVGEAGEVRLWNRDDERWQRPEGEGVTPRGDLLSVQVAAQELVYAASSDGNVYHWDGAASCPVVGDAGATEPCAKWAPVHATGRERPIFGLWASGERSMAVGEYGLLVSFEGRERRVLGEGSLDNFLDVAGSGSDDIWVAGDRLLQKRSDSWQEVLRDSPRAVYSLQVPESGRVLVAGTGGMARSYAESSWVSMDVRADALLRGLWSDGSRGWLVGSRGQTWGLLNERLWTPLVTPTERDLRAVWSSPTGKAWAVGEGGVILRHDGIGWAAIPSGPDGGLTVDLRGVWGSADDDVWAVGTGGSVVHWDGRVWARATPDATFALNDVWGRDSADAWAVGSSGTILHFDGEQWQTEASGSEHALNAIWGRGDQVWAVGEHGTILVKRLP
ncbi:MAG: hypothetical protein RL033_221 [Pseudomonadota bacterium]